MTTENKLRIEVEADRRAQKWLEVQYTAAKEEYIAGATAEYERMANIIEKAFIAGRSQTSWEQFKKDNDL